MAKRPTGIEHILSQLNALGSEGSLDVEGTTLALTNLDKPLAPEVTKRQLITYYAAVSPWILPHLKDRPLTLTRYPNGIGNGHFFQKDWTLPTPACVERVTIASPGSAKGKIRALFVQNLATLVWLANLADIEMHVWYSRIDPRGTRLPTRFTPAASLKKSVLNYSDFLVFDLDPGVSAKEHSGYKVRFHADRYKLAVKTALVIKKELDRRSLTGFVKTSGKTGVHVYVPVKRRYTFDDLRAYAVDLATDIEHRLPDLVTTAWAIKDRGLKTFIDTNQNARGRTLASPYSLRPTEHLTVSMPLSWKDVTRLLPSRFTISTVPQYLHRNGDAWADILDHAQDLR